MLTACGEDEPRFITIGGPPDPDPLESYRCVDVDDSNNPDLSVMAAALSRPENSEFASFLPELKDLDLPVYLSIAQPEYNSTTTVFLPNNNAMDAFYVQFPDVELSGDNLVKFVRSHILIDLFDYQDLLDGNRQAITVNIEELPYQEIDECIYVGKENALILTANDRCFRGIIHTINKVIMPSDGF